jgi:hypothetical protein
MRFDDPRCASADVHVEIVDIFPYDTGRRLVRP